MTATPLTEPQEQFLVELETAFRLSNIDFARAYFLFATARLSDTYNSEAIYQQYPILTKESTFQQLKALYDEYPENDEIARMFTSVLDTYTGNQLASLSDEIQNLKNQLMIDVSGLGLKNREGELLSEILYEDVMEWLKKVADKATRQELYDRMSRRFAIHVAPKYVQLLQREDKLFQALGYADRIAFYSRSSGHPLTQLGHKAQELLVKTEKTYKPRMAALYRKRTGLDFSEYATRADIAYVFNGEFEDTAHIDAHFPEEKQLPMAIQTFDGLGLNFSTLAETVNFQSVEEYHASVSKGSETRQRILLDISKRVGKRSRAYVYPSQIPSEIYLSVKPHGGLDDFVAFFHESGHAQHFAYTDPSLPFSLAMMGNNTVTETYAYLMMNLFLNRHWLQHVAGVSAEMALTIVEKGALNDLYMLRRYASKLIFELSLFNGSGFGPELVEKAEAYATLLTKGTGFLYDADGWTRDVDAGFYVADYFTAWALEAQLRTYLAEHFGTPSVKGEDWYANPEAGAFLKSLWKQGNINQETLSATLGFNDPSNVDPLQQWMDYNLLTEAR